MMLVVSSLSCHGLSWVGVFTTSILVRWRKASGPCIGGYGILVAFWWSTAVYCLDLLRLSTTRDCFGRVAFSLRVSLLVGVAALLVKVFNELGWDKLRVEPGHNIFDESGRTSDPFNTANPALLWKNFYFIDYFYKYNCIN